MIVASNRTPQDWYGLFPSPVLPEGALDRLVNSAHHVLMPGRSYRPLRRPDRETKLPLGPGVPSSPNTPPEREGDQGLALSAAQPGAG